MAIRDLIRRREREVPVRRTNAEAPAFSFQRDVNRLFDEFFRGFDMVPSERFDSESLATFSPKVNVAETEKDIVVSAELPGLDEKNVSVEVEEDALVLRGEKREEKDEKGKNWHRVEHSYGSFHRVIPLPVRTEGDKAKAQFKKGMLTVTIPKAPEEVGRRKTIEITTTE